MGRIIMPVTPGLVAAARVANQLCWPAVQLGFPAPCDATGQATDAESWLDATHCMWDDNLIGPADQALLEAIAADPAVLPDDTSGLDRDALRALYPRWADYLPAEPELGGLP